MNIFSFGKKKNSAKRRVFLPWPQSLSGEVSTAYGLGYFLRDLPLNSTRTGVSLATSLAALVLPWRAWTLSWTWQTFTGRGCVLWVSALHLTGAGGGGGAWLSRAPEGWAERCFPWVTVLSHRSGYHRCECVLPPSACEGGSGLTRTDPGNTVSKLGPSRCVLSTVSTSSEEQRLRILIIL